MDILSTQSSSQDRDASLHPPPQGQLPRWKPHRDITSTPIRRRWRRGEEDVFSGRGPQGNRSTTERFLWALDTGYTAPKTPSDTVDYRRHLKDPTAQNSGSGDEQDDHGKPGSGCGRWAAPGFSGTACVYGGFKSRSVRRGSKSHGRRQASPICRREPGCACRSECEPLHDTCGTDISAALVSGG